MKRLAFALLLLLNVSIAPRPHESVAPAPARTPCRFTGSNSPLRATFTLPQNAIFSAGPFDVALRITATAAAQADIRLIVPANLSLLSTTPAIPATWAAGDARDFTVRMQTISPLNPSGLTVVVITSTGLEEFHQDLSIPGAPSRFVPHGTVKDDQGHDLPVAEVP